MDVVAVSFLPPDKFEQRKKLNLDAIIVLEQVAPGKFVRHTLESVTCDYVSCVAGDLFGTGRPDLVLGNYLHEGMSGPPVTIWRNLGKKSK